MRGEGGGGVGAKRKNGMVGGGGGEEKKSKAGRGEEAEGEELREMQASVDDDILSWCAIFVADTSTISQHALYVNIRLTCSHTPYLYWCATDVWFCFQSLGVPSSCAFAMR